MGTSEPYGLLSHPVGSHDTPSSLALQYHGQAMTVWEVCGPLTSSLNFSFQSEHDLRATYPF